MKWKLADRTFLWRNSKTTSAALCHVIGICLYSQSASEKHNQGEKAHIPLRTSWISWTKLSATFDNHKILLFWPMDQTYERLCRLHTIRFSDHVDLWVIKIKKPMILCARSMSRSREQSKRERVKGLFYSIRFLDELCENVEVIIPIKLTFEFSGWTFLVFISGSVVTIWLHHSILFTYRQTDKQTNKQQSY